MLKLKISNLNHVSNEIYINQSPHACYEHAKLNPSKGYVLRLSQQSIGDTSCGSLIFENKDLNQHKSFADDAKLRNSIFIEDILIPYYFLADQEI